MSDDCSIIYRHDRDEFPVLGRDFELLRVSQAARVGTDLQAAYQGGGNSSLDVRENAAAVIADQILFRSDVEEEAAAACGRHWRTDLKRRKKPSANEPLGFSKVPRIDLDHRVFVTNG
ncbi:hypothetical protein ACU8NH_38860 (plasmid) [Rhizobium leguminosarum]|uniref:hypothetical protein n=1 Tax=Rhizobium leguminosarum TaxID=384 RepID=UPI0013E28ED9|nr:hypothetical protein [Rhizobium leguminosarum]